MLLRAAAVLLTLACLTGPTSTANDRSEAPTSDVEWAERFAGLALECVHRPYPNKIAHVLAGPRDAKTPKRLTPIFYGCYDWHSSVHGHWLLVRLARTYPDQQFARAARVALNRSFRAKAARMELEYLQGPGRASFERPYGLAWLLQLCAELREWDDPQARKWIQILEPLERETARRIADWLPKLAYPIRTGEHSQTAFAFGLILDWARIADDSELETLLTSRIRAFHDDDRDCPLGYEPSGQDFLSPCLAQADLMRRVQDPKTFAAWLDAFLPTLPKDGGSWLPPAIVTDASDPKLAHLDGLNLARAWMLEGIESGLPVDDPRRASLRSAAQEHRANGLASVTGEHYEGGHWLGSFATYLVTRRGIQGALE